MADISIKSRSNGHSTNIQMKMPVIVFQDDQGYFIAHVPVLDLSGYGSTEDEAKKSLDIVINDYIEYALNNNSLHDDLMAHGFTFNNKSHTVNPPHLTESVKLFSEKLIQVLENKPYTKTDKSVNIPAYC